MAAARVKERWRFRGTVLQGAVVRDVHHRAPLKSSMDLLGSLPSWHWPSPAPPCHSRRKFLAKHMRASDPRVLDAPEPDFEPLPDSLLQERRWKLIVKGGFRYVEPIHLLEGRIMLQGTVRCSRAFHLHGHRFYP